MPIVTSAEETAIVSRNRVIETLRTELRTATVVERRLTAEQIAQQSGVSIRTVRSYMANDAGEVREASLSAALSIAVVLGGRSINALLALIGYGGAAPLDEMAEDCPLDSAVAATQALSTFLAMAADRRIDHTERTDARHAVDMVIAELTPWSSAGQAV